jgi:type IV pilus assembly protein PilO
VSTTVVSSKTAALKRPRLSPPVQLGIAVAVVVLIAVAGWFLVVSPKKSTASDLEVQIADAQLRLTQARVAANRKPAPPVETSDLFRLAKAMPDQVDMSGILLELNRVASDTGIEFESISPGAPAPVGAYEVVPVTVLFEGNFYSLSDFLFRLRNLVSMRNGALDADGRLFNVDTVTFGESENRFPSIRATLQLNAFVFGTATAAAAAPPAAPATTTPASTTPTTTTAAPTTPSAAPATTP